MSERPSAEKDALLRVLNDHAWERSVYTDHAPPYASIGNWGWRCPCGVVVKGEAAHREHVAQAIIAARVIPPGSSRPMTRLAAAVWWNPVERTEPPPWWPMVCAEVGCE